MSAPPLLPGIIDPGAVDVEGWRHRAATAHRLLADDGVRLRTGRLPETPAPGWTFDPVPHVVGAGDWAELAAGLAERAELLAAVLDDVTGPGHLVRTGVLPAAAVHRHPGFLRAAHGLVHPPRRALLTYSADVVATGGAWSVLADRTATPDESGRALENRRVAARILSAPYRRAGVRPLGPYLAALRVGLREAAPAGVGDPRVVVLTPGPEARGAFDHALVASQLGFPLVQGSDLARRDGGVWMRSLDRPEPVHVILRQVDPAWCDPLELRPGSRLGVPGLTEAARRGAVTVVNHLGAGVLESPALAAFLPAVAAALLGRPLGLPSVPCWWCGEADGLRRALDRLGDLVLRRVGAPPTEPAVVGWTLDDAAREALARRLRADPDDWVAQERVEADGAPGLGPEGLASRPVVLRVFALAQRSSYLVLPGALARVGDPGSATLPSSRSSAPVKDVWVLADQPGAEDPTWLTSAEPAGGDGDRTASSEPEGNVSPRSAEQLFWLGRYAERAEDLTRLLRVVQDRRTDAAGSGQPARTACSEVLLAAVGALSGIPGPGGAGAPALVAVVVDHRVPGTLAHAVNRLVATAYAVRDQLSGDTWVVVGALDREIAAWERPRHDPALADDLRRVLQALLALAGLAAESMVRDAGWLLMDAGRRIERSVQLAGLLGATLTAERDPATEGLLVESVLIAAESIITYRRRYRGQAQVATTLDLLLTDPTNPRSVAFGVERTAEDLAGLPGGLRPAEERLVNRARTALAAADTALLGRSTATGARPALATLMAEMTATLEDLATVVADGRFDRELPLRPWPFAGGGR